MSTQSEFALPPDLPEEARAAARFPGARPPQRRRTVTSSGVRIAVYEWGDEDAEPLLLVHGGFDFARTFDVFAPRLARDGYRVIAWDHRGHGDSEHTALYSWDADVRDLLAVLDSTTREPIKAIGHSKGGGLLTQLMLVAPHRFTHFVNIDGIPSGHRRPEMEEDERVKVVDEEFARWLDHTRKSADRERRPGTLDGLAERRKRMNPRLSLDWLRYLVVAGARHDVDGWRWKLDPVLRFGGFGPWRPEFALGRLPGLGVPMIVIIGEQEEPMGWGARREQVEPWLPPGTRSEFLPELGHFAHIEDPERIAGLALDFLS